MWIYGDDFYKDILKDMFEKNPWADFRNNSYYIEIPDLPETNYMMIDGEVFKLNTKEDVDAAISRLQTLKRSFENKEKEKLAKQIVEEIEKQIGQKVEDFSFVDEQNFEVILSLKQNLFSYLLQENVDKLEKLINSKFEQKVGKHIDIDITVMP